MSSSPISRQAPFDLTAIPVKQADTCNTTTSAEQKKEMIEVAVKVVAAIVFKDSERQSKVDQLLQSFIDFAEKRIRLPIAQVQQMDTGLLLYAESDLSLEEVNELRRQYSRLSGYSLKEIE